MMVPRDGLEPSLPKKMDFESIVSTNSTTAAKLLSLFKIYFKEAALYEISLSKQ